MTLAKLARLMGACPAGMLVSIHPHCSLVRPDQLLDCILDSAPESQAAALATNALFTTNNGSNTRRSGVSIKSRGSPDRSRPRGLARSTARSGERSDRGAVDIPPSERKPPAMRSHPSIEPRTPISTVVLMPAPLVKLASRSSTECDPEWHSLTGGSKSYLAPAPG